MPTTEMQPSLDIPEVARLCNCSIKTVRRMIDEGSLPAVKVGKQWRIRPEHVAQRLGAA